jgi:hypothetical protein
MMAAKEKVYIPAVLVGVPPVEAVHIRHPEAGEGDVHPDVVAYYVAHGWEVVKADEPEPEDPPSPPKARRATKKES